MFKKRKLKIRKRKN